MALEAKEIKRQAIRVDEELLFFGKNSNDIIVALYELSNIIKSEDSNLAKVISSYRDAYISNSGEITNKFKDLSSIMHTYADKTLGNEETIVSEVENIKAALADLSDDNVLSSRTSNLFQERTQVVNKYNGIDMGVPSVEPEISPDAFN